MFLFCLLSERREPRESVADCMSGFCFSQLYAKEIGSVYPTRTLDSPTRRLSKVSTILIWRKRRALCESNWFEVTIRARSTLSGWSGPSVLGFSWHPRFRTLTALFCFNLV